MAVFFLDYLILFANAVVNVLSSSNAGTFLSFTIWLNQSFIFNNLSRLEVIVQVYRKIENVLK